MSHPIFIISASRSSSTAMIKMLGTASNAKAYSEPEPKLCLEQRLVYQYGKQAVDIDQIIKRKRSLIEEAVNKKYIYVDKNPNYILFFPYFQKNFNAKLVVLVRDGRDVVRSCMDWVNVMGKELYKTHEDNANYIYKSPCDNPWDYSFFRPKQENKYFPLWKDLDDFEKFSWYWNEANKLIVDNLKQINKRMYKIINVNDLDVTMMHNIFDFAGLEGFDEILISEMLSSKINSVEDRIQKKREFEHYSRWSAGRNDSFFRHATEMMEKLGYRYAAV